MLALLVESLDGLLPTCRGRTVPLTEITKRALSRAIGCSEGLDERPIPVFLAVFVPLVLAKIQVAAMVSGEKLHGK
jgi:hypothetical protein